MSRDMTAAYERSEGQYLDIVDYIVNNPNTEVSPDSYLAWPHRSSTVDWGCDPSDAVAVQRRLLDRFEHLALASTVPQRPDLPAHSRNAVWFSELIRAGGVFYRLRRATYVLDTSARWRRNARGLVLVDHRWPHYPPGRVRNAMDPRQTPPPRKATPAAINDATEAAPVEPAREPERLRDLTPDVRDVDATPDIKGPGYTIEAPTVPTYTVEAAGGQIGAQIVLRRTDPDGSAVLLLAQVSSVLSAVTS